MAPKSRDIMFEDYENMKDVLMIGDCILSYSKGELTNYLIEGEYKHCAMYAGLNTVVEAVGSGVRRVPLAKFLSSKDKIAILRPSFMDAFQSCNAAMEALNLVGTPYDYAFEPSEKAFYCAELLAYCYQQATNDKSPFVKREVMGVSTILPTDYKLATSKFNLIAEYPKK